MKRTTLLLALLAATSCNPTDEPTTPKVTKLAYDTPEEWTSTETKNRESTTTIWTPAKNDLKESITVVRSKAHLRSADFNEAFVEKLLVDAQKTLPNAALSQPSKIKTSEGFAGVQLDIEFTPKSLDKRYHRIHAVLLDGEYLLHVFYTSATKPASRDAFTLVLNSIHHEEA